jgi:hypothetical protein
MQEEESHTAIASQIGSVCAILYGFSMIAFGLYMLWCL